MKKHTIKKKSVSKGSKDWSGVNALLANIRETPLSQQEKGSAYVGLAEVYLDTTNDILERYKRTLEATLDDWGKLDKMGKSVDEKLSLAKARVSLNDQRS